MEKTRVLFDPAYTIAQVDPRIFGGFLEHMDRAVSEGVYDSKLSHACENGFRRDILGDGILHAFMINRGIRETAEIEIDHGRGKLESVIFAEVVSSLRANSPTFPVGE